MLPETHRQVYLRNSAWATEAGDGRGALAGAAGAAQSFTHQGRNGSDSNSFLGDRFHAKPVACRIEFALFLMCTIAHPPSAMA